PRDDFSGVVEPSHMGVAGGENAIWVRKARIILDGEKEFRHCLIEAPAEEMCLAYYSERRADAGARAEAQRGLEMFDRDVGLARPLPESAADQPAARVVRVEGESTVDQCHHGADVLAEIAKCEGGIRQNARIIAGHFEGSSCEVDALPTIYLPVFTPIVLKQPKAAECTPGECGPVTRIARDRLLQKTKRLGDPHCRRHPYRIGAQVKVVGGQI